MEVLTFSTVKQCHLVRIINYDDKRLLGFKILCKEITVLVINVYIPYESILNLDEHMNYLGKINSIMQTADTSHINANTYNGPGVFGRELLKFCNETNLFMSDLCKVNSL